MSGLKLRHFEALATLHDEPNLVKAALKLGVSQPTLSRTLLEAESLSGEKLFSWQGRSKKLTSYGTALAEVSKKNLCELVNQSLMISQKFAFGEQVYVRIGGRGEILDRLLSGAKFKGRLGLHLMASTEVIEALRMNEIDLGVTDREMVGYQWISRVLFEDQELLIVPRKWTHGETKAAEWLKRFATHYPLAIYSERFRVHHEGKELPFQVRVDDWRIVAARVFNGLNWAVVPSSYCKHTNDKVTAFAISSPRKKFFVHYRSDLKGKPWLKELLELIQSETLS